MLVDPNTWLWIRYPAQWHTYLEGDRETKLYSLNLGASKFSSQPNTSSLFLKTNCSSPVTRPLPPTFQVGSTRHWPTTLQIQNYPLLWQFSCRYALALTRLDLFAMLTKLLHDIYWMFLLCVSSYISSESLHAMFQNCKTLQIQNDPDVTSLTCLDLFAMLQKLLLLLHDIKLRRNSLIAASIASFFIQPRLQLGMCFTQFQNALTCIETFPFVCTNVPIA